VRLHRLRKRHVCNHGGIPNRLQLHVAAILRALQLDDHQIGGAVDGQEIDAPTPGIPLSELLADDVEIPIEDLNLVPQHPLQILSFLHLGRRKIGPLNRG